MIPHLVCYVGAGLSGRSTSLLSVMRSQGPATEVSPGVDYFFDGLRLRLSLFRGKYWYDDPNSPTLNSSLVADFHVRGLPEAGPVHGGAELPQLD